MENKQQYNQTWTEKFLARRVRAALEKERVTLNDIREGKKETKVPLTGDNLRKLLKGHEISLNLHGRLIKHFGYKWELLIVISK